MHRASPPTPTLSPPYRGEGARSLPLQQDRRALPPADAEGGEAEVDVAAAHLVEQGEDDPRAGRADRVAERDRAAVDVEPVGVELADGLLAVQVLAGEGRRAHRLRARQHLAGE